MATVGFWNENAIDTVPDLVLVRQSNFEYFLELVQAGELPTPQKIFVVAPNGYGLEDLLAFYILGRNLDWDIAAIQAAAPHLAERYSAWRNLLTSLAKLDHATSSVWIEEFSRSAQIYQTRADKVTTLLRSYVRHCLQPLADVALYRTYAPNQSIPWWLTASFYEASLSKFRKEAAAGIAEMPGLEVLTVAATLAAKPWTAMAGKPTQEKFFDLSAFCFGLAERYFALKNTQWAFLLVHRSLDLYFQYLALREGIIIEKSSELGYPSNTDKLYLVDLEYALYQAQALVASDDRRKFLIAVNDMRNQLLLTHGAHHVTDQETAAALKGTGDLVVDIEASTKWRQRSTAFFPPVLKGLSLLFESVPDIHTFVEDRTAMIGAA